MTTVELKSSLIRKLASIDDEAFLNAIHTIIDARSTKSVYKTSERQKDLVREGIEQIEAGSYFSNKQVDDEINQWLNEK